VSAESERPDVALRPSTAVLTAAATGFGVMAAELTAVRLLAPHFGDSAYVWTNVIGVILAAMALGAMLGGRLSARSNAQTWPMRLLLSAGILLLLAPYLTQWLGGALLPDNLPLDAAMPALIRGSLVATALVFAPPMMLLAAVSPLLVVLLARGGHPLGRAAGDVAAAGTLGSLAGTFAATHWLVPGFGCRIALAVAAGVLLVAATLASPPRLRKQGAATALLSLLIVFGYRGPLKPVRPDIELLAERETAYQFLQVHHQHRDGDQGLTSLVINEGLDSFHSLAVEGSVFTNGAYYDWHMLAPGLASDDKNAPILRALSIGDAAGTLRQIYAAVHPGIEVDAVDIDAETMALGDDYFPGPKAEGDRYAIDGRLFLAHADRKWNIIHVDAYAHQVYVPAHLASREFFQAAYDRLEDGGILACNVGALNLDDAVLSAVAATVGDVFEDVRVLLIPQTRNALLVARRARPIEPENLLVTQSRVDAPSDELSENDRDHWQQILAMGGDPTNWHSMTNAGPVLRDDQPLLDELLFASYVDRTDPEASIQCNGPRSEADAEQASYEAFLIADWRGVLEAVATSRKETPYLRQLAGDARWHLRELKSAKLEYALGLATATTLGQTSALAQRIDRAREELIPIEAAESAATRNGWFALLASLGCIGLFAALRRS
jgi:spermidine synthase